MKLKTKVLTIMLISMLIAIYFTAAISAENINTNQSNILSETQEKKIENIENNQILKKGILIPRLFVATVIFGEGFEITNIESDEQTPGDGVTFYQGNVKIEGTLDDNSYGYACSYIANKIGNPLLVRGIDPSFLPGWYNFEEEFTIKARLFILSEKIVLNEDIPPVVLGFGFFVRVTN